MDHCGHENTRVFQEVTEVGQLMKKLDKVVGMTVKAETAVIYDWENNWIIGDTQGPRQRNRDYLETCHRHYSAMLSKGIPVDVIDMECDFSKYRLLIAPMLYMLRSGVRKD